MGYLKLDMENTNKNEIENMLWQRNSENKARVEAIKERGNRPLEYEGYASSLVIWFAEMKEFYSRSIQNQGLSEDQRTEYEQMLAYYERMSNALKCLE